MGYYENQRQQESSDRADGSAWLAVIIVGLAAIVMLLLGGPA